MDGSSKCPVMHGSITNNDKNKGTSNKDWWPNQLNLSILRQHDKRSNPMGRGFNYREEFNKLDYTSLKNEIILAVRKTENQNSMKNTEEEETDQEEEEEDDDDADNQWPR